MMALLWKGYDNAMSQNTKRDVEERGTICRMKKSIFRHGLVYGVPVIVYAGLIFLLSSVSKLPEEVSFINGVDKWAHCIEYYFFGFLIYRWLINKRSRFIRKNAFFFTILIGICFGLSDEWHQSYVPGRDATIGDVLADSLGIIAAAVTYHTTIKRISFLKKIDETLERKFVHEQ
jgi:VanZ family protein